MHQQDCTKFSILTGWVCVTMLQTCLSPGSSKQTVCWWQRQQTKRRQGYLSHTILPSSLAHQLWSADSQAQLKGCCSKVNCSLSALQSWQRRRQSCQSKLSCYGCWQTQRAGGGRRASQLVWRAGSGGSQLSRSVCRYAGRSRHRLSSFQRTCNQSLPARCASPWQLFQVSHVGTECWSGCQLLV